MRPGRPSSPPSSGQLSRSSGRPACASNWCTSQAPAKSATAGQNGALQLEQPSGCPSSAPSSRRPSGTASQPGWYGKERGGRGGHRARARLASISADQLERPPDVQDGRQHGRGGERQERGREPRLDPASQRVGHDSILRRNPRAATFIPTSVSAAGKAHCAETPARASVRVASVSAGTVESSARTIQSVLGLELVVGDEAGEKEVVLVATLEARRADHLLGAVERAVQPRLDAEASLHAPRARAARPSFGRADTTARRSCAGARRARGQGSRGTRRGRAW